jgi:peptidyl-Asp metalloendopeptidase
MMEKLTKVMSANMKISLTTRLVSVAAVAALAMLQSAGVAAAPRTGAPVLENAAPSTAVTIPARGKAQSAVLGTLNQKALSASGLEFTFADGQTATATLERVTRDDKKGTQSWIGSFEDSPGSLVVLSKAQGVVTGFGTYQDQTFELQPSKGGKHVFFTVDNTRLPQAADPVEKSVTGGAELFSTTGLDDSGSVTTTGAAGAVVHDVLIVYTSTSAARWGAATLQSMIQNAVQAANQAYINSYANITVNVVGVKQVSMRESGSGMYATMGTLEKDAEVQGLRKSLYADMVVLVSEDSNYCGYAKLTKYFTNGVTTWWDANSIVYSNCLSNQTVAHELGHLQGLDHNKENTAYSGWYSYSYGYRRCTTDGFLDIMSYPCSGAPKISVFSNPSVYHNGYPTGVANVADTARTLNETATTVAGYMVGSSASTTTVPASPSSLAASSVTYNSVSLTWLDNATNESGYKVERSLDGVTFTEIASLGAGTRNFTNSVSASTRYYYRVRAYNSAGVSGYSNTVSVTTPSAPVPTALPSAPTSVAASNRADGSALVTWGSATNATSYEVRRETWDSRKQVWGRSTIAGTVSATITSMIDTTNNGTYRYFVKARNSGGSSAEAGPAQVTVSGGSKGRGAANKL